MFGPIIQTENVDLLPTPPEESGKLFVKGLNIPITERLLFMYLSLWRYRKV